MGKIPLGAFEVCRENTSDTRRTGKPCAGLSTGLAHVQKKTKTNRTNKAKQNKNTSSKWEIVSCIKLAHKICLKPWGNENNRLTLQKYHQNCFQT